MGTEGSGILPYGGIPSSGTRAVPPADDWMPMAGSPGWHERMLIDTPGLTTQLMRVEPGTVSAPHAHDRLEQVYVLSGSLTDNDGAHHPAGSFIVRAPGAIHGGISHDGATLFVVYGGPPDLSA